jgi:hypothetical protein
MARATPARSTNCSGETVDDFVTSLIRTNAAVGATAGLLWLINRGFHLHLLDPTTTGITSLAIATYYTIARILEHRWPALGLLLLGSRQQPVYSDDKPRPEAST